MISVERQVYLANLKTIQDFLDRNLVPDVNTPPWLRLAAEEVKKRGTLPSPTDLDHIHRMGGVDYPQPNK